MASLAERGLICERCQVPVAPDQRYCLACGAHLGERGDPVARYLAEATAARARLAMALAAAAARPRWRMRLGARGVTLMVVLALCAGIALGSLGGGSGAVHARAHVGRRAPGATSTRRQALRPPARATGSSYLQLERSLPDSVTP